MSMIPAGRVRRGRRGRFNLCMQGQAPPPVAVEIRVLVKANQRIEGHVIHRRVLEIGGGNSLLVA